jgi:hypothetical protein
MSVTARLLAAVAAGVIMAGTAVGPAVTAEASAQITARSSEDVVEAGEAVILRGRFTIAGDPAAAHVVKVQTGYVGNWQTLKGARVRTGSDGRYRVRVVLCARGVRDLRVVGVVPGPRDEAFDRVTLMVKPSGDAQPASSS